MNVNLIDYVTNIASRAGVSVESDAFKAILTDPKLAGIEVPAELVEATQGKLYTYDEAKINPDLKKYFSALALNVADKNILSTASQFLDAEELAEISKEEVKTIDKVRLSLEKLKAKAIVTDNKEDKQKLIDKIAALQADLVAKEAAMNAAISDRDKHWVTTIGNGLNDAKAMSYNYAGETPKPIMAKVMKETFEQQLKKDGGAWVYADNSIKLVNAENPDLPFSINNKVIGYDEYWDKIAEPSIAKHTPPVTTPVPTPIKQNINNAAKQAALQSLRDLEQGVTM